ncbi:MAG: ABC transporter [Candidatus Aramenus sulfurataquae]|jgi:ABC-2 type transport system ATP-binding protein|uniref:ABC transporter n=2 Tax=Candidatus Aramenus sulfurataquae TaxID=1326980 RepID=W7KI11_9CREN|nr:MAG: ABC transporter [Candidatus Aramenus sulfurataquae]MCL7343593.1 ABC transporter ATP-binding protein [Candidatus Aramenus sulfurataquae]
MTNDSFAVSVTKLTKKFGDKVVLDDVTFEVKEGEVFGIIGPNGAGKTTTLRIIAGIIRKYEGEVRVYGLKPVDARKVGYISYMPEDAFPYDNLTGYENLEFYAKIYSKGDKAKAREYVERGITIANLGDRIYDRASSYSRGMKRRLLIARTLMVKPKVAILDEPTTALDVESAIKVRETIRGMRGESTIVISSHNMLEVEYLCDSIVLINHGRVVAVGRPKEIVELTKTNNLEEAFIKLTVKENDKGLIA